MNSPDEQGFIVVYLAGTSFPLRWRTGRDAGSDGDPMRDVTFISQLIDTLAAQYNIDPQRIYPTACPMVEECPMY